MLPNKTIIKRLTIEQALTYINWSLHFVGIMAVIYIIYAFFMTQFDILPPTSFGGLTYSSATIAFMVFGVLGAIYMVPESVRHGVTRRQSTAGNFYGIVLTALLTILLILIGHGLFHVVLNLISDQYVPGPSLYEQVISTETTTNIHLFGQGVLGKMTEMIIVFLSWFMNLLFVFSVAWMATTGFLRFGFWKGFATIVIANILSAFNLLSPIVNFGVLGLFDVGQPLLNWGIALLSSAITLAIVLFLNWCITKTMPIPLE